MRLKHLAPLLPSFIDELEKDAGIRDDLRAGTTKVLSALKAAPKKAGEVATSTAVRAQTHPKLKKVVELASDPLNTPDIGHAVGNLARMFGH